MIQKYLTRYRKTLIPDLMAGLTGAVAGAPQAMGFAIIAGISPIYGLYSAFVSTVIASVLSNSTFVTVAPTNSLALIVASAVAPFEGEPRLERIFLLTILVGVFQLVFGLLNLGQLTRFVSNAVMTGFIAGAGVLIIIGQLGNLTGVEEPAGERILVRFWYWLTNIAHMEPRTTLVGMAAIIIILALHRTRFKTVATLTAIIITTVFVVAAGWDRVQVVEDMGQIPPGLPGIALPDIAPLPDLLSIALAMAVLASVQSAGISRAVLQPDNTVADSSQDFVGQGIGNIVGGFFQGMPAGGSISRTAVNVHSGARTRMANIFSGLFVGATLILFGGFVEKVVLAALAGQLIIASFNLINLKNIRMVWRVSRAGRASMTLTFVSTLVLPLEYSIYLGIILSLAIYIYSSAGNLEVVQLILEDGHQYREVPVPKRLPPRKVVVLHVYGHLYFAAVERLEELLPDPATANQTVVVLRLRHNHYLGSTGIQFLERYAQQLEAHGGRLILTGIESDLRRQLERTGALDVFGRDCVYYSNELLFNSTENAVANADEWIRGWLEEPA